MSFPLIIHLLFISSVKADRHKALVRSLAHVLQFVLGLVFKDTHWCSLLILYVSPYMEYTQKNTGEKDFREILIASI